MMKTSIILCAVRSILFIIAFALPICAQADEYTRINIKDRVQLELPSDWAISDSEQRKRVKEFGEKLIGTPTQYITALSAQSYPTPPRTMVRVSFISMEQPFTQADVQQEIRTNKQQVLKDMAEAWREESSILWKSLAKYGAKEVGRPHFAVEPIGGKIAFIYSYGRTSAANPAETMRVTQYHVLLGSEKALITLSHIEGDQRAIAAHNRLKNSIVIQ